MDQTEILMQILICLEDIKREQAVQTKLLDAAIRFAGDFNAQYSGDRHRAVIDARHHVYEVKPACS